LRSIKKPSKPDTLVIDESVNNSIQEIKVTRSFEVATTRKKTRFHVEELELIRMTQSHLAPTRIGKKAHRITQNLQTQTMSELN